MSMTGMTLMLLTAALGRDTQPTLRAHLEFDEPDSRTIQPLAEYLAARMFAKIGVRLEWVGEQPAGECSTPIIVIQAVSRTPLNFMPAALGYAQLYHGGHITVFLDRIEHANYPAFLLAHVMVHELTHMAQGINRHSGTGIMKAHWSGPEMLNMRFRPLPFDPEDVHLIYEGFSRGPGASADGIGRAPLSAREDPMRHRAHPSK